MSNFFKTRIIITMAGFCCLVSFSQTTLAAVVDFESVALGSYSSFISGGINFSLTSGDITVSNDNNGVYVSAAPDTHFLDNRSGGADFIFSMATPVNEFGLQIGATNSIQTLSAFDSGNSLLGSISIPDQVDNQPYPYTGFYSLNFSGISKVTLTSNQGDWIVVDNITTDSITTAVPEPETYAMMLAGLGLMGFIARRRNNEQA
jgi:hypothetical protein